MFGDLKILQLASALARHASARHEIIAQNIANADTPGYKAKDLEDFTTAFERASFDASKAGGVGDAAFQGGFKEIVLKAKGAESPNENTVSIEDQIVRATDAQGAHDAAVAIYQKTMDILRSSLGRGA